MENNYTAMTKKERTFKDWTEDDVRIILGLKKLNHSKLLDDWLEAKGN